MPKNNSPYSASFTGANMMLDEMNIIVPLLLKEDNKDVSKLLRDNSDYLKIKSSSARERVTVELRKRFNSVPASFWERYLTLSEGEQRAALFFVILKTYKLLFEFQVNVAVPKFNSIDRCLSLPDVSMELCNIASKDSFVDSWTENTRQKICSSYLTILKQAGLVDTQSGELQSIGLDDEQLVYYVQTGDLWFLQACFLPTYRLEKIKQLAI